MKTLVFFTGGMDSTYVLYKLLTDTTDEVTAVLLKKNPDNDFWVGLEKSEVPLIDDLVLELKKIRDFTYIEHEITEFTNELSHWYTQAVHYAAPLLNSGAIDRISTGRTFEQHDQSPFKGALYTGTPSEIAARRLWEREVTRGELWNPLETNEWVEDFCRADAIGLLPANLKALTVSCHSIKVIEGKVTPCGKCHRCLWDQKVRELVAQDWTSTQINTWRKLKSLQYGGGNGVTCPMRGWLPLEMGATPWRDWTTQAICQQRCQDFEHYSFRTGRVAEGIWTTETSDLSTTSPETF